MSHRLAVYVYSADLISQAGTAAQLRGRPEVYVVEQHAIDDAAVAIVVVVERIDADLRPPRRAIQRDGCPKVLVVATDAGGDRSTARRWMSAVLSRATVTPESLAATVVAVADGRSARSTPAPAPSPVDVLGNPAGSTTASASCWPCSPRATTPRRSPTGCSTRSGRSSRSSTTSPRACTCATAPTPSPTRSSRGALTAERRQTFAATPA